MRSLFLATLFVPLVLSYVVSEQPDDGKLWVFLVAGSRGYENYRHQADVCHAYQIIHGHGIPDENIIVMMYDDIAFNPENPDTGSIINKPGGPNVYTGVPKDYTGDTVSATNFLQILVGNKTAMKGIGSEKVIESGPNDRIFVYFTDHGAKGFFNFGDWDMLSADDLRNALEHMLVKKSFKELLFYVEACYSGSMFEDFLQGREDISIVAVTAANARESSYATYYDERLLTALGDEFSVAWMEHVDEIDDESIAENETVMEQYLAVSKRVQHSHPQLYGGDHIKNEKVHKFIGLRKIDYDFLQRKLDKPHNTGLDKESDHEDVRIASRDFALYTAQRKLELAKTKEDKDKYSRHLHALIEGRRLIDDAFENIVSIVATDPHLYTAIITELDYFDTRIMPCYKKLVAELKKYCFNYSKNIYVFVHFYKLENMCSSGSIKEETVVNAFKSVCTDTHRNINGIN